MPPVCPVGSTTQVKPGYEHSYEWSAISYIDSAVLSAISPFLDVLGNVFAPQLFSIDSLCGTNIDVPPVFVNGDWTSIPNDFSGTEGWPSPLFVNKINQYIQAGMWEHFCQCGPSAGPVAPPTPGSCGSLPNSACNSHGFGWAGSDASAECLTACSWYVNLSWLTASCSGARVFAFVRDATSGEMPAIGCFPTTNAYELTGSWTPNTTTCPGNFDFTPGQYGPFPADPSFNVCLPGFQPPGTYNPLRLGVSCPGNTGLDTTHHWGAAAQLSLSCPPSPPTAPTPPTITVPTPPAVACDATTLCNISWNIWKTQQTQYTTTSNTNTQTTNISIGATPIATLPPDYTEGSTHALTGDGTAAVASGTLGLRVTLDSLPPWQPAESTDPISYFNAGWVVLGSDDGWDNKRWLHYDAQLVFPTFPKVTRFAWNLEAGVTATATELIPPPPPV